MACASHWHPAQGVGGDYFDAIALGDSRLAVCIADVVGKGTAAAILMSNLQAVVRSVTTSHTAPADVCALVNEAMCGRTSACRFITFCYALLDRSAGTLAWSNAGHNPPIVQHADGRQTRLSDGGTVLGVFPNSTYRQNQVSVGSGDRVVLFTDGIVEARDEHGNEFGDERLAALIAGHAAADAERMQAVLFDGVSTFCRGAFLDDATLLVMAAS